MHGERSGGRCAGLTVGHGDLHQWDVTDGHHIEFIGDRLGHHHLVGIRGADPDRSGGEVVGVFRSIEIGPLGGVHLHRRPGFPDAVGSAHPDQDFGWLGQGDPDGVELVAGVLEPDHCGVGIEGLDIVRFPERIRHLAANRVVLVSVVLVSVVLVSVVLVSVVLVERPVGVGSGFLRLGENLVELVAQRSERGSGSFDSRGHRFLELWQRGHPGHCGNNDRYSDQSEGTSHLACPGVRGRTAVSGRRSGVTRGRLNPRYPRL